MVEYFDMQGANAYLIVLLLACFGTVVDFVVQMNAPNSESRASDVAALSLYSINKFCYPSPNQILEKAY